MKKRVWAVLMLIVMAFCIIPSSVFAEDDDDAATPAVVEPVRAIAGAPANEKKLIDNGDGTYTLALSVTGATESSTTTQVTKANVILVVDTSNSMNQSSGSTTPLVYTEFTGNGTQGSEYWGIDAQGQYMRVYWRNNVTAGTSHWRLTNNSNGTQYTGTVYTLSGGDAISRINAEKDALTKDEGIIDKLLGQNVPGDSLKSDIIEVAIVNFGTEGHTASTWSTDGAALKNTVNGLTTSTGTNWEGALDVAIELANNKKTAESAGGATPDPTYIIFLTDGEPTTDETRPANQRHDVNTNYATEWGYASDEAREIITSGYTFYGIFTWGSGNSSHYLSSLVQFAYTGTGNSNSTLSSDYAKYFTNATDTTAVIAALQQAIDDITNSVGYTNVEMTDGVTSMTTSSVKTSANGDVTGVKYYRSGGSYSTTANGGLGEEWADAPHATFAEEDILDENGNGVHKGDVDWDLGNTVLENGVTYTIAFTVWPSQESLDLVADLNNGIVKYDNLTPLQKSQIEVSGGHYSLKTNKDSPTITYSTVTTTTDSTGTHTVVSNPTTATIAQPDSVGLAEEKLNALKEWKDELDPSQREDVGDSVTLYLKVDGHYYYVDANGKPLGVTLTEKSAWTETDYLAVAPGLMVTKDSPAYPGDNVEGVTYVEWDNKKYAILEKGHDYVWEESDINHHFELIAYTHHPMIMGHDTEGKPVTKDVVFKYASDGKTIIGIESVSDMTDSLSATNILKGGINIEKKVVDDNGNELDDKNSFKVKVTVTDADGNALPLKTLYATNEDHTPVLDDEGNPVVLVKDYTIDYRIYYGTNNPAYETSGDKHRSDHIYVTTSSDSLTTFTETIYVGDVIRVVNVETGALFDVTELDVPEEYTFDGTKYLIAYETSDKTKAVDYPDAEEEGFKPSVNANAASFADVINKYAYGNLEVTKTVTATNADDINANKEFEFTFKLYKDDTKAVEMAKQKYAYTITTSSGETSTGVISSSETFNLKHGDKIKIDLLPAGSYYVITETADAAYTTTSTGETGVIKKDETSPAAFTNATKEGTLTLEKTLANGSEQVTIPGTTEFTITGTTTNGKTWTKKVTYAELTAEGGGTWTVPVGSYAVTEDIDSAEVTGYSLGDPNYTSPVTVSAGGTGALRVENTYSFKTATLKLEKVLASDSAQVTVPGGTRFTISGNTDGGTTWTKTVTYTELQAEGGNTFTVPTGTYSVTEDKDSAKVTGYTLGEPVCSDPVTLEEGGTDTLTVTNTYTRDTATLKITKKLTDDSEQVTIPEGTTFTITGPSDYTGPASVTYKDFVNGGYTIENAPTGEYTITETASTAQVTGYTLASTTYSPEGGKVELTTEGAEVVVTNKYTINTYNVTVTKTFSGITEDLVPSSFTVTPSYDGDEQTALTISEATHKEGTLVYTWTLTDVPYGTEIAVSEDGTDVTGWTLGTVTNSDPITVDATGTQNISITNPYTRDTATLKITKKLADDSEQVTIPEGTTFTITGPSDYTGPASVTYKDFVNGSYTIENAPTGEYTIAETASTATVAGYTLTSTTYDPEGGKVELTTEGAEVVVTNSYSKDFGTLKLKKIVTGLVGDDVVPDSTKFVITGKLVSGETFTPIEVTYEDIKDGNWSEKVPVGTYSVTESGAEVTGYDLKTEISNEIQLAKDKTGELTVKNTYTRKMTEITVTKIWVDEDNKYGVRPESVKFTVTGSDKASYDVILKGTGDTWTAKVSVPEYTNGVKNTYTVDEEKVTAGYAKSIKDLTITNTFKPCWGDPPVKKVVEGDEPTKAETFTFKLTAVSTTAEGLSGKMPMPEAAKGAQEMTMDVAAGESKEFGKFDLVIPGVYTYTITEVAGDAEGYTYSTEKHIIVYTVTTNEDNSLKCVKTVDGVEIEAEKETAEENVSRFTFTNKYTKPVVSVKVSKIWEDGNNEDLTRPESIKVELYANGKKTDKALELSKDTEWAGTFEDLDKYDAEGKEIKYTVDEAAIPEGYTAEVTGDMVKGFVITNSVDVPPTGDTSDIFFWSGLSMTSLLGLGYLFLKRRKEGQ